MAQHQRFVNKVVIVTGSSSGIGQDAAIEFAKEGATVVIHGQSAQKLKETEEKILSYGTPAERIFKIIGSLAYEGMAGRIVDETLKKFGKIDVLVNNAGALVKPGLSDDMYNLENLNFIFAVNFRSIAEISLLALPHLKKVNGNVLNISSITAVRAIPPYLFYCSMKAALDHWTRGFAQMAAPEVRVNSLNPGPIETAIWTRNSHMGWQNFAQATLLDRFGTSAEMSSIILFLCSNQASYVTGAVLLADGGMAVKTG